jgi:hypothetical protein
MVERPQDTNCTSIELPNEGVANGLLSQITSVGYDVEYDEEDDVYRVGEYNA